MLKRLVSPLLSVFAAMLVVWSCQHEPDENVDPSDPNPNPPGPCDTLDITYQGDVYPIFEQYCIFCHSGEAPQGGIDLTDYETVSFLAQSGQLLGSINHDPGYSPMPQNADKLSDCDIRKITIWINDTTWTVPGDPCDPDTVYFERDLLPIFQSSCAQPGCHDAITQEGDVRMTDYNSIMQTADVRPFDPEGSDLYEVIIDSDPDKRMPPPPSNPLSQDNIDLIYKWINQGAQNLFCDEEECDTLDVKYSTHIEGIVQKHCLGCHSDNNPLGGLSLQNYNDVVAIANDGRFLGAVRHENGYSPMPKNAAMLSDCKISQIEIWIENGTPQ